jgi:DNA-directed RNA polymerase
MHPEADRRSWTRFASRIEGARSARWSDDVRAEVGALLADALATGAPAWFEVARIGEDPRAEWRPICVALTDHAVERMADVGTRAEVARPLMLPMIVPPNPWRYRECPISPTPPQNGPRMSSAAPRRAPRPTPGQASGLS